MTNKKILVFAPYGAWGVHHQLDAVIATALRARGSEVRVLACDGIFEQCFIAGKPPSPSTCRQCSDAGNRLFSMFGLPAIQMRSLLTETDLAEAKAWADSVPTEALATARFEGADLGDWISSSVHSYFLTGNLDFADKEVADMYRKQLRNGVLIQRAMRKILAEYRPHHLLSFNSLHSYYRVAFEMARRNGVHVLVHERGLVDDTFLILPDSTANHYQPRFDAWERWKDIPLDGNACRQVWNYFNDRENGKSMNYKPFYDFSSDARDVRRHLRIPPDGRIVVAFASTEREIGSIKGLIRSSFDTQIEWLRKLASVMESKDVYLVIRHHPNNTAKGVVDKAFLKAMAELNLEYGDRVRVAMPYERITAYAIVRNAEAVFTFFSTTEAEAVLQGVPAVCAADSVYVPMGVDFVKTPEDLPAAVDRALAKSKSTGIEDLRRAYRFAYYLFFKLNFRFASVGIKNIYEMDIRFRAVEDLQPGRDPALDQVCRHILEEAPLFVLPSDQDRLMNDREETAFLQEQLAAIRAKRVLPGSVAAAAPSPLLTILRAPGRAQGSRRDRSLRRSRHKNLQQVEIPVPSAGPRGLVASLRSALAQAKGEYVLVAPENVALDESLLSSSVDIFAGEEGDDLQTVIWGAWLADSAGNVRDEFLAGDRDMADFESALEALPALKDPFQMLAFFVMRRSFLADICDYLDAFPLSENVEISALVFESFYLKEGCGARVTRLPMLMFYPPASEASGREEQTRSVNPSRAPEGDETEMRKSLRAYVEKLERDPYDRRAIIGGADLLKRMGEGAAALSMLNHYLGKDSADEEIRRLAKGLEATTSPRSAPAMAEAVAEAMTASAIAAAPATIAKPSVQPASGWSAAPGHAFAGEKIYATYADAKPLVETVSGWLLPGQEEFLFNKAKAIPEGGHILEMGADRGRSTSAMALACSGSDKRIFSVDTFCGNDGIMGKTYDFLHEWYGNLKRLGVESHCEPIKGFTFDVLPSWSGRPMLDFVFIDASHEYIDVLKDFRQIYPYVKPGGWIAFHDVEPGWPGPWRVWLEHAVPLLIEHEVVATLACGRKVGGRSFDWAPKHSGFSFAAHWVEELARAYGDGSPLFPALRASLGFASAPESGRQAILQSEQILARLPEPLVTTLNNMLAKDAFMDGHLHLWRGIVLKSQGKTEEARAEFQEAGRVSYPVHPAHAAFYLSQVGGPPVRPAFSGQAASGQAAARQGSEGGYYGREYFDWQKRIGAFGGVANLFKFRDHVKDTDIVVDFGSGGGFLLRNLPGRAKVGVELNETARKESSLKVGIDACESAAELSDGFADVIVSNHALEHVESPLETLRVLRKKLKPGGRMVFVVPHEGPQIAFDPADINKHLYTWNPMTLGNLFTAAGFEVLACENIQHQWPPDFMELYERAGETAFHQACREHAVRNGTYQVRVIARAPAASSIAPSGGAAMNGTAAAQPGGLSHAAPAMAEAMRAASQPIIHRPLIALDDIPVALIAYKRHEHTARVLDALKDRGVRNVHIFCDGAKSDADAQAVEKTRAMCRSLSWTRPIVHESPENKGLARSIMGAVDGLLADHETLILLEDDCVPQRYFFDFMRKALTQYREAEEVFGVSGYTVNVPDAILARYPHDVYFLPRIGSWGWATWKRAWAKLERDLGHATREAVARGINLAQCGSDIPHSLNSVLQGQTKDVWTLNWLLTVYLNRGYFAYPTVSHIDNIGMDGTGVHCGVTDRYATRLAQSAPTRFPERVGLDADLISNYRKYYDL